MRGIFVFLLLLMVPGPAAVAQQGSPVPENLYTGDLLSFPGPWAFQLGKQHIILTSDQQLDDLQDPDKLVDLSLTGEPRMESLRQICERAQAAGQRTLIFAFDHFFNQYRGGVEAAAPRRYMPDTPEYIERIAAISRFASGYGIGLELSLLSPLEIGRGYRAATGESGAWLQYRKGLRDPQTGAYSVELWQHRQWSNNKGPIALEDAGVRVFAFRDRPMPGAACRVVDPAEILEITDTAQVEHFEGVRHKAADFEAVRIRVHGAGRTEIGPLDRVMVLQQYRTPELDYFSAKALPFLKSLVDQYVDAGVQLNGLYSDEMHIQQDWHYMNHHDHGQFTLRYMTPSFAQKFAALYGPEFADFAKYMVYFIYAQEDASPDVSAAQHWSHVWGGTQRAVHETAQFRARYYRLLQDEVVNLFTAAKRYAEERIGHRLESRAHATWAQSPTIDKWQEIGIPHARKQYEYTSDFLWSNTIQQAASACYDYFKWGEFLTGNGNDHAEGGWLDRNYYGLMLACSTGSINEIPYSYGAHWGMPAEVNRRRQALVDVFGAAASPHHALVQESQHREVDVLMLYPMDLVAVEERFGSWMTQYAYANLITQQKLLELGEVREGRVHVAGRGYTTLCTLFEPFPSQRLLNMMRELAQQGGRVIWSSTPPLIDAEGGEALPVWQDLFGVDVADSPAFGIAVPGRHVTFPAFDTVPDQAIPTHLLVDRIFPVQTREDTVAAATVGDWVVGSNRKHGEQGRAVYLGFRPRDDQAASLGFEVRTWFELLGALGAYPASGAFEGVNDNTEHLSRTTDYACARFPNDAVAIAPHLRSLLEDWPGGFARDAERDAEIVATLALPDETLALNGFQINGLSITYNGTGALTVRAPGGALLAFAGQNTAGINVNGREYGFSAAPLPLIAFAPVAEARRILDGALFQVLVHGAGEVTVPLPEMPQPVQLVAQGARPGSRGETLAATFTNGTLRFDAGAAAGRWLYVVPQ